MNILYLLQLGDYRKLLSCYSNYTHYFVLVIALLICQQLISSWIIKVRSC